MALKWSEDLAVGVDMIDNQHKWIFARTNDLLDAMEQGKGKEEVCTVLAFLADYIREHFSAEEELMVKHNYGGYSSMKAEHRQFTQGFSDLKKEVETKGVTSHSVVQTQLLLCNWLVNHISKVDKALGTFLKLPK